MGTVNVKHKPEEVCSIARTLDIVGDKSTFLILREASL